MPQITNLGLDLVDPLCVLWALRSGLDGFQQRFAVVNSLDLARCRSDSASLTDQPQCLSCSNTSAMTGVEGSDHLVDLGDDSGLAFRDQSFGK